MPQKRRSSKGRSRPAQRADGPPRRTLQISIPKAETNSTAKIRAIAGSAPVEGSPGYYVVTTVLGTPGLHTLMNPPNLNDWEGQGDSLLLFPKDLRVGVTIVHDDVEYPINVHPNAENRLAYATMRLWAVSFDAAQETAFDLISPLLSIWSYRHDVALSIRGHRVVEEATQSYAWTFRSAGQEKPLDVFYATSSEPAHRAVLSAYRDALNSESEIYMFLSLFRVIEGVYGLRADRRKIALAQNQQVIKGGECIPTSPASLAPSFAEVWDLFVPYQGWKFTRVRDALKSDLRNAIAHLNPLEVHRVGDRYADIERVEKILPVTRYMARVLLESELPQATPYHG